jgi:hypothetical protein
MVRFQKGGDTKAIVDRVKKGALALDSSKGFEGYRNNARLNENYSDQPEMHPMTKDRTATSISGAPVPIYFDPSKSKQKKGGAVKKMQKGGTPRIYGIPQTGMTGPNKNSTTETMQSGGFKEKRAEKKITKQIKKSVKTSGDIIKAKFGASVPVQHSPKPGRVRSASGVGTVPVGTRKKRGGAVKKK